MNMHRSGCLSYILDTSEENDPCDYIYRHKVELELQFGPYVSLVLI